MAGENTVKITTADFEGIIEKGVTLVDFWAPWCGPCRMVGPIIDQLADDNAGKAAVGKVDVDENPELAQRFKVMTIPTLIVFKDGQEISRAVGARPKPQLQGMIDEALS